MKLVLSFNGAQSNLGLLQPVVVAAGGNSTVALNTSQAWATNDLTALAQAAGAKNLSFDFDGDQTPSSKIRPVVSAAGSGTAVSMSTAHTWSSANLISLAQLAGAKRLGLSFNGANGYFALVQPVMAAAGANTTITLASAQAWSSGDTVSLAQTAGAKNLSVGYEGNESYLSLVQPVAAAAGANTTVSVNTAQAWAAADLSSLIQTPGNKRFTLDFNGAQSYLGLVQLVVSAAGTNATVSVNTAQAWPGGNLVSLAQTAGSSKRLRLAFYGAQTTLSLIQPVVNAAGANAAVSMSAAQGWTVGNLQSLAQAAGATKVLSVDFNGAQSVVATVQQVIAVAGANTTVSINTAQVITQSDLIALVVAAG